MTNEIFLWLVGVFFSKSILYAEGYSSLLTLSVDIDLSDVRWMNELWLFVGNLSLFLFAGNTIPDLDLPIPFHVRFNVLLMPL